MQSGLYALPAGFPREVELVACDLDGTLLAPDLVIRERTAAAISAARAVGIRFAIVTGRMYQSAVRYARAVGLDEPIVCYQGAAVVDPSTGEFLRHEPIPVELAREAIAAVQEAGHGLNVYVDDELYVADVTPEAERYARFQHLELHPVGDLLAWLERPPTKLVSVAEPDEIDALKERMVARFGERLHVSKSLPIFLELSRQGATKGSGLAFLARLLEIGQERVVAFGDAENDLELLQWAGYGICVANGDPSVLGVADHVCPRADEEGVAQVLEAIVDRRRTIGAS
jgi:Cof subfamily protein (haloacid dehalogenase superfamily)